MSTPRSIYVHRVHSQDVPNEVVATSLLLLFVYFNNVLIKFEHLGGVSSHMIRACLIKDYSFKSWQKVIDVLNIGLQNILRRVIVLKKHQYQY